MNINLVFPHQLFKASPFFTPKLESDCTYYLVEEDLFFTQFPFHKQKIAFHRNTMKQYQLFLENKGFKTVYIESTDKNSDIRKLINGLTSKKDLSINMIDPTDNWLSKRITESCDKNGISLTTLDSPLFLNTPEELRSFFKPEKKKFHQTTFYKEQRKLRDILLTDEGKPVGEKWTFDTENRKKYPAKKIPPTVQFPSTDTYYQEACEYTQKHFAKHLGNISETKYYPSNFEESEAWLQQFLEQRFMEFGPYEDAIVQDNSILHHSVLTPMLNVGLLTPQQIIDSCLSFAEANKVPINTLEGFIRQIIGWREFIRGMYEVKGSFQRVNNFWGFKRKIPASFYDGTTGIPPIDDTIKKVLETGYCNHIERLMVLSSFMLLCEFDPDEVYRWFMELFIDAYDWVMVPNVYGMSQFSDGGLFATKPYISGSNYVMKMSNYKKGEWQASWDGLFWTFMNKHRDFLKKNPRLSMLISMYDKMPEEKQALHQREAKQFMETLS